MPSKYNENNKKTDSKKKKTKKKKSHKILKICFLTVLVFIIIGIALVVGAVTYIMKGDSGLSRADFEISELTTIIYDKYGNEYATLYNSENRMYASYEQISPYLPKAFIAIEDERFETHFGIDIKRTGAATLKYITTGNSDFGGSTITQQLIKKVTKDDGRNWQRKVREIVRAIQLEQWLSKTQIIELYMNVIYYGEGAYGAETAAYTYFNKPASDLSIAECALLAGLAQAPEGRNPYKYPEAAKARQELVLGKMLECNYISSGEYEEAKAQELVYEKGTLEPSSSNSYFVDAVIEKVIDDLEAELGVTPAMAQKMVYSNGLKIYTTIDPDIQKIMEEEYEKEDYFKLRDGTYDPKLQSAMVVIDYKNGNVVGLVGGAGEKTVLRGLNRALVARAPGSTIKPIGVYAPGINEGIFTSATVFDDIPTTFKFSTTVWNPSNSYAGYRGLTPVRKAVEISSNIIAAKAFENVGATISRQYLKNFGVSTLTNNDVYPATLALGGLSKGISPLEHAAAYGTIANSGIYIEPKLYTEVYNNEGERILQKTSDLREVLTEETAYIMTDILEDVVFGISGTGTSAAFPNMSIAGKTGTTNDSKDKWFAGYTPYYVGSVWVGYDTPTEVNMSGNPAARLWKGVMSKIHAELPNQEFRRPSGVAECEVCIDSGLLATDACRNDPRGDRITTSLFDRDSLPTEECTTHVKVRVCGESGMLANPVCKDSCITYEKYYIDRQYEETPSVLPKDYDYEVPKYCNLPIHYCPVDEEGNFVWDDYNDENEWGNLDDDNKKEDDDEEDEDRKYRWE